MKARFLQAALLLGIASSFGASARSTNFVVTAPSQQLATQVAQHAEAYRRDLAVEWLGRELPRWRRPCPITVTLANGAGGATSFMFDNGRPFGWTMNIQGSPQRILDSVLPHEVTHTIFATHFGRPLPRWADEGACTTVEDISERRKQDRLLVEFLTSRRGIPFNKMFAMKEYPRDILPLYSQGYSLAKFLIAQGGKRKYIEYVGDGMQTNDWNAATKQHYGFEDLSDLQVTWNQWVAKGSPPIAAQGTAVAAVVPVTSDTNAVIQQASASRANAQVRIASAQSKRALVTEEADGGKLSWYAKQRDQHRSQGSTTLQTGASTRASVSRPSPTQRPRQTILEWQRDPNASRPAAMTSRLTPVNPPASYRMPTPSAGAILR